MTDKERILMTIITRIIPGLLYGSFDKKEEYVKSYMLNPSGICKGDLVFANTTLHINDFVIGFVDHVESDCVVIREIGSNRLCNYHNESFSVINKEKLGYEILEGFSIKFIRKQLKHLKNTLNIIQGLSLLGLTGICVLYRQERLLKTICILKYHFRLTVKPQSSASESY